MKIIKDIVSKMNNALEEAEEYASKAHHYKSEYKSVADTFSKIADMHLEFYGTLHDRVVKLIEEQKSKGVEVAKEIEFFWEYEREKLIKEFAKAKFLLEEYKKTGY